ncbi:PACE efflux transporter [Apibacter sp. HY039]|uniref:PACE efflux transporter n=1 Tax=Apibacter sp. HY039 TaxID=2501476 RepID=UPI000FEB6D3E|nr:PACE efflux transporter [Apibacter sp. HY039]
MKFIEHIKFRTPYERSFHAIMYEAVGILTSAPIISFLTDKSLEDSVFLALLVSITAMLWNYIFNWLFDQLQQKFQFNKNLFIRILHGAVFEIGLIIFTVPLISWILKMSFMNAFFLELSMLLYFFPYTIVFNWVYDKLRFLLLKKYS